MSSDTPRTAAGPLTAEKEAAHLSDGFDTRPEDGWFHARCTCGWQFGPLPDAETAVDALMEHAFARGASSRKPVQPKGQE